jgi:hypothetical protein
MSSLSFTQDQNQNSIGQNLIMGLTAGVIAAALNLIIFFVGRALIGGIDAAMQPGTPFEPLPFTAVIMASIIPSILAGGGLWFSRRFIPKGTLVFQIAVVLFALFSLGGPFGGQIATTSASLVLASMHLVVGGMILWVLTLRN